jgi:drug/metabolite transporter (DMT)-like permease
VEALIGGRCESEGEPSHCITFRDSRQKQRARHKTASLDKSAVREGGTMKKFCVRIFPLVHMNGFLYALSVLAFGTTWICIKMQLGVVPAVVSLAYRFWIAAAVMFAILLIMREPLRLPRKAWGYLLAQSMTLFCCNFICFYFASQWVPSGLVAVVFSTAPLWNSIIGRIFLGRAIQPQVVLGTVCGLAGIALLFLPQMQGHWRDAGMLQGLAFAVLGTLFFSTGNLLSSRMHTLGLTPWLTTGWAMLFSAAMLSVAGGVSGVPFTFDFSTRYVGSLLYLAISGSVIGFLAYLSLVGRIGPERAAYCTLLFPVVALLISTVFEGYQWTLAGLAGVALVAGGNLLAFLPNPRRTIRSNQASTEC